MPAAGWRDVMVNFYVAADQASLGKLNLTRASWLSWTTSERAAFYARATQGLELWGYK